MRRVGAQAKEDWRCRIIDEQEKTTRIIPVIELELHDE